MTNISDSIGAIAWAVSIIRTIGIEFGCSPYHGKLYNLEQTTEVIGVILKYLPFNEGDRVVLNKNIECTGAWRHSAHFLINGAEATVDSLYVRDNSLYASLIFDDESWINSKGDIVLSERKHTYLINVNNIERRSNVAHME